jgi:hypothetical protein
MPHWETATAARQRDGANVSVAQRTLPRCLGLLMLVGSLALAGCRSEPEQSASRAVTAADVANRAFLFTDGAPLGVDPALGPMTLTFGALLGAPDTFRLDAGGFAATGLLSSARPP